MYDEYVHCIYGICSSWRPCAASSTTSRTKLTNSWRSINQPKGGERKMVGIYHERRVTDECEVLYHTDFFYTVDECPRNLHEDEK